MYFRKQWRAIRRRKTRYLISSYTIFIRNYIFSKEMHPLNSKMALYKSEKGLNLTMTLEAKNIIFWGLYLNGCIRAPFHLYLNYWELYSTCQVVTVSSVTLDFYWVISKIELIPLINPSRSMIWKVRDALELGSLIMPADQKRKRNEKKINQ